MMMVTMVMITLQETNGSLRIMLLLTPHCNSEQSSRITGLEILHTDVPCYAF